MRHTRVGFFVGCLALLGGGTGVAHACISLSIAPSTSSAGPGDPVGFTISQTQPGARWTVSVDGRAVANGTATGPSVEAQFSMPDLGSASRPVTLAVTIAHEDIENSPWVGTSTIDYVAPAEVGAPHQATPAPPHPATTGAQHPVSKPRPASRPAEKPTPRVSPASHPRTTTATPSVAAVSTPSAPAQPQAARAAVRSTHAGHAARKASQPRRLQRPAFVQPGPPTARPIAAPRTSGREHVSRPSSVPWWLVPLGLVALLSLGGGPALLAVRRRRGKPSPEGDATRMAAIEAELQEIVAEERAKRREPLERT